jgi:4-amino-4-deoxy-L-arabinose transferase-like glycosyltransferase
VQHPAASSEATPARTTWLALAALLALLVLGAIVRLIGIDFGRPFAYHPDEGVIVNAAMGMVHHRDWNPHVFYYPSLLFDIEAAVVGVIRVLGGSPLDTNQGWLFASEALPSQFGYFLAGRWVVAALGLATIPVTFAIGLRLQDVRAGLVAAAVVALAPLHVTNSRYVTTDVPLTLLCALTLLAAIEAQRRTGDRWWVLAGALAGLATSMKWNGVVILIVPVVAYLSCATDVRDVGRRLRRRTPYLMLAAAVVALVAMTPAILFDTVAVRDFLVLQANLYARVLANERSNSFVYHLGATAGGMGPIAAIGGVAGCLTIVLGRHWRELAIPAFIVAWVIVISLPATHFARNLLPIAPYLAVALGLLVARSIDRAAGIRPNVRGISSAALGGALAIVLLVVGLGLGAVASYAEGRGLEGPDTRTIARDWLVANVPAKSIVAREQYTPQLTPDEFRLRNHDFLWQRNWAWYHDQGVRYLITSSLEYARFYGNPDMPAQSAFYTELFTLPQVFRVDPDDDTPGPTIRVFELTGSPQAMP